MKRSDMLKILSYIMADFDAAPSDEKVAVWYDQCKHLDPTFAMEAARALMRQKQFGIPKVSDYLEVVEHMTKPAGDRLTVGEAWRLALDLSKRYGLERRSAAALEIKHLPRLVETIRQVGWKELCMTDEKGLPFLEKRFAEYFNDMKERDEKDTRAQGLIGVDPRLKLIANDLGEAKALEAPKEASSDGKA